MHTSRSSFWGSFSPYAAWAALLISVIVGIGSFQKQDAAPRFAGEKTFADAKDFGAGLATLMLESYHTQTWSHTPVRVDSAVTPASVQELADRLNLYLELNTLIHNRRYLKNIPRGGILPGPVVRALEKQWEPRVVEIVKVTALLRWAAYEGVLLDRTFGGTMRDHLESDLIESWPGVAHRINRLLQQLGMEERLDESYSANREEVTERCWMIDEALEAKLGLRGEREPGTLSS